MHLNSVAASGRAKIIAGIAGLSVVTAATLTTAYAGTASTSSLRLAPVHDAYVNEAAPSVVHNGQQLAVSEKDGSKRRAYLRFDTSGIPAKATVTSAVLKLKATDDGPAVKAFASRTDAWTESSLTYENQPWWKTAKVAQSSPLVRGKVVALDVTSAFSSNESLAVTLTANGTDRGSALLGSSESTSAPRLVITYKLPVAPTTTTAKPATTLKPTTTIKPTTTTAKPTTTTTLKPTTTTNAPAGKFTSRGIPTDGSVFVGAAISGNADPSAREAQLGSKLAIHRTFWQANQVDKAVAMSRDDLAEGRLPWISFKLPADWASMANGSGDAWAQDIATKLGALDGPVWVAFHHEPEKDGPIADWTAMQKRLSPIIRAKSNIAFTIIPMGYHQFHVKDPEYQMEKIWPGDGLVDVIGMDPYNKYGNSLDGSFNSNMLDITKVYFEPMAAFAKAHGAAWGVAETGYTDEAAQADPEYLNRAFAGMKANGGVAFTYFDSILNSTASWPLDSQIKQTQFSAILRQSARLP